MSPLSETPATPAPSTTEACPPPLQWQSVVEEFRAARRTFTASAAGRSVTATEFGQGPPLLFLGPASGDLELFALLAWLLRDEFRCVFLDYPPIGWPVRGPGALDAHSAAALAVADSLESPQVALFAAGFGSSIALGLSLAAPERVSAQILVNASPHLELTWLERGLLYWGSVMPGRLARIPGWRSLQRQNHGAWFPPFDQSRTEFLLNVLARTLIAQCARRLLLSAQLDFRPRLRDIAVPTLVVHTEGEGAMATRYQHQLREGLPEAQAEWMHTSGQLPYLTHPHRVARLVRTFLARGS